MELLVCWRLEAWNLVATAAVLAMAVQAEMAARMTVMQAVKTAKAGSGWLAVAIPAAVARPTMASEALTVRIIVTLDHQNSPHRSVEIRGRGSLLIPVI